MRKIIHSFLLLLVFTITTPAMAALNIFACEPEWASLANELGGERVKTFSATTAYQDPHHIEARPGLIAKVRRADLLICSGAELEVGWLPLLQRQAGNTKVLSNARGYFEASAMVKTLDVPVEAMDRTMGDVHAAGNPHVHLDPRRILTIATALNARLAELDPQGKEHYQKRYSDFKQRWQQAITKWQQQASGLKGKRIIVHHRDWVYLFDWLGIEIAGALEPKPGLPTTAGHLVSLKQALTLSPATMIVYTAYQNPRAAKRFSQMTNIPAAELPYTVGGAEQVNDLFSLFDVTIKRLSGERQ
ncbi:MAG: zinc ABC transporter substrate-binding protein [Gammaproteobacteria bacterium]|nr:zinc ABC transporter substrate-binding protein [Gammaproteobacteria bacterium]MCW9032092.1 zinc ABC transporter substrate-binding protein [Gammaproteobacteria bacterium]